MTATLETPADPSDLYLARGDECEGFALRPAFTGDVLQVGSQIFQLVQHPCAMRRGSELVERQVASEVERSPTPKDWARGNYKRAFLPNMEGQELAARFDLLEILTLDQIEGAQRIAILSQYGVNLLMQRWVYHNARVIVPTGTFNDALAGPYEEADLVGDLMMDLVESGATRADSSKAIEGWLSENDHERRRRLETPQFRSTVRRDMSHLGDQWLSDQGLR